MWPRVRSCLPVNLVLLQRFKLDISGRTIMRSSSGNPGLRFRSEVPDNAAAAKDIVLAALARIHIELRHTRPEVSSFTAQAEPMEDLHIESEAGLEYTGVGSRFASVIASEEQGRAL